MSRTITPRVQILIDLIGQDEEQLFQSYQATDEGSAARVILTRLVDALEKFVFADQHYERALASVTSKAQDEVLHGTKGFTANAMWIAQAAEQAVEASVEMKQATETILVLVSILKHL